MALSTSLSVSSSVSTSPESSPASLPLKHFAYAVRCGTVYYPKRTFFRSTYHPWYCELHRESNFFPRQLVLYEASQQKTRRHSEKDMQFIPLDNVLTVALSDAICLRGKLMFTIVTSSKQYFIGVDSLREASDWVDIINKEVFGPPIPGVVYEYRVAICDNKRRGSRCNSYILKLYDDKVKLFTANGRIALNYSFYIKDICKVDFQPTKKQSDGSKKGVLKFSINNSQTMYREKEVLSIQAKSTIDLIKAIYHRKKLLSGSSNSEDDIIPRAFSLDLLSSEQRPKIVSLDKKKPQSFEPRKRCLTQTWSVVDGESTLKENCKSDQYYETLSSHSKPIISSWKKMLTHQEKILNLRKTNKADLQEQKSKLSDSHHKLSTSDVNDPSKKEYPVPHVTVDFTALHSNSPICNQLPVQTLSVHDNELHRHVSLPAFTHDTNLQRYLSITDLSSLPPLKSDHNLTHLSDLLVQHKAVTTPNSTDDKSLTSPFETLRETRQRMASSNSTSSEDGYVIESIEYYLTILSGDPVVPDDRNTYAHVDECDDNVYEELLLDGVYSTIES
ncbi:uncharacterized protein [Dysidea avara]|uniref:uncharacterized protein isoform X2 n=1 Tax=Dysidea avara TaxID=196820 RepID=UPI00331953A3